MNLFYEYTFGHLTDADGTPITRKPKLVYSQGEIWKIHLRDYYGNPVDISNVVAFHAAVDIDHRTHTRPMTRVLPEMITANPETGCVTVRICTIYAEFFRAVDRIESRPAFFELRGMDVNGDWVLIVQFGIRVGMTLGPPMKVPKCQQ